MERKSTSYLCTLDANSVSDMQMLDVIKKTISLSNRTNDKKKRVALRGRKPLVKKLNPRTGRMIGYNWAGDVVGGIKNATILDVYVYDRR